MAATSLNPSRTENVVTDVATSAVSWGAILAGAFVIASVALILVAIGTGFGLASVSP